MIKDVKYFEELYQVDIYGNVISKAKKWVRGYRKEYFLKPKINTAIYVLCCKIIK